MLQYDFDESVGCWIALTNQALRREMAARIANEELTLRQWEVLAFLVLGNGELSQTQLAEMLGIEAPTMAGIVSRMEEGGWLVRVNCSEDRRRKLIRLSEKVESVWGRMVDCCHEVRQQATEGFSRDELLQLKDFCERIRANLNQPSDVACRP